MSGNDESQGCDLRMPQLAITNDTSDNSATESVDQDYDVITRVMRLPLLKEMMPEIITEFEKTVSPEFLADLKTLTGASSTQECLEKLPSSTIPKFDIEEASVQESDMTDNVDVFRLLSQLSLKSWLTGEKTPLSPAQWSLSQVFADLSEIRQEGLSKEQLSDM